MCEESDAREGAKIDPNERFWRMRTKRMKMLLEQLTRSRTPPLPRHLISTPSSSRRRVRPWRHAHFTGTLKEEMLAKEGPPPLPWPLDVHVAQAELLAGAHAPRRVHD